MALKLGELLINRKLFTRRQLEEALEAQALFGGRLGTVLIEMGAIGELDLAQVLSEQLGVPFANPDQLVDIPDAALKALTPELAQTYQVLPLRLENRVLTVVMANPHNIRAVHELGTLTGYVIRPFLVPELRLSYALEHYYRLPRKQRGYLAPQGVRKELARLERGGKDAAAPITAPPPEPDLVDLAAGLPAMQVAPRPPQSPQPTVVQGTSHPDSGQGGIDRESLGRLPLSLKNTVRQLASVRHQDDVAEALLGYLGERYARAALFKVVDGQAIGWCSAANGRPITGFQNLCFSLAEASSLHTVVTTQKPLSGPLGKGGADLTLLQLFGKPVPFTSLILPLTMRGRVVSMIYLDDPHLIPAKELPDLQKLSEKTVLSLEMLIIKNKILRL